MYKRRDDRASLSGRAILASNLNILDRNLHRPDTSEVPWSFLSAA
ncbi:MAG: hypothetical protein ACN4GR_14910 [Arenicellales bacterium]